MTPLLPAIVMMAQAATLGATEQADRRPMAPPAAAPDWTDEFGGKGIDRSRWRFDTEMNARGWYNHEAQYYADGRAPNSRIENGRLVIEARHETLAKDQVADWGGQRYTSARLVSRRTFGYGFYEIAARLPCARGTWPAIWLLPAAGKWPDKGEIDIMEMVGFRPQIVHATLHSAAYNHVNHNQRGAETVVPGSCTGEHRYQLDWQRDAITIGVDGRSYMRVTRKPGDGLPEWPFTGGYNLILNVAVGGDWGGAQGIDDAAFPQRMAVDYVRFWAAPPPR